MILEQGIHPLMLLALSYNKTLKLTHYPVSNLLAHFR